MLRKSVNAGSFGVEPYESPSHGGNKGLQRLAETDARFAPR